MLFIGLTLFAWTAAPLLVRFFSTEVDLWTSNGLRYATAALFWLPLVLLMLKRGTFPMPLWKKALLPAVFNVSGQVCFVASLYETSATMVAFGLRMQLIAVGIGGAIFFAAERRVLRRPAFIGGMVLILIGVVGFLFLDPSFRETGLSATTDDEGFRTNPVLGAALAGAAGILFGCYALAVRPVMKIAQPIISYAVISMYTAGVLVVLMLFLGERAGMAAFDLSPGLLALFFGSALLALVVGHPSYYAAIRTIGVTATASVLQLQPITVGVAGFFFLGSVVTLWQAAAGAVAVGGAFVMLRAQQKIAAADRRIRLEESAPPLSSGQAPAGICVDEDAQAEDPGEQEAHHASSAAAAPRDEPRS